MISMHTHTYLQKETRHQKQSQHKSQICPSPLHPPLERAFAHSFNLKEATLRWLQPLQVLDGGYPPQQSQHSHIPASNEPFSNKPRTRPRDASAPLPGCWRGGKGQQHSSPKAESSLVLQYDQKPVFGMGDHSLGKQSSLLIAKSRSTGMEKLTLKGKDWTEC